jgi:hypothetical protein
MPGGIAGDHVGGGRLAASDAELQLAGVIRHLIASECRCDVSYRYRLVVPGRGGTRTGPRRRSRR